MAVSAVIATNGLGMPVRPVDENAPAMQIAENGLGIPIVISDMGVPFVVSGLTPDTPPNNLSGDTWPEEPQATPPNLIPAAASEFDTATGWDSFSGLTIEDGVARWDGTSTGTSVMQIALNSTAIIGNRYGLLTGISARDAGTAASGMRFPALNAFGSGANEVNHWSRHLNAAGEYTVGHISVSAGAVMDIDYFRVYDITALLEKKWRVVFVYSQSNWVATTELPADRYTYDTPEARAVVIPSRELTTMGAQLDGEGAGVPMLMCDPVVHLSGGTTGGPAGAFARNFCDGLRDDEVLVYVACGYSGGGRLMPGDPWYHDGDGPDGEAWTNLLFQMDTIVDRMPEGSSIAGMLFCQGEADVLDNSGDLHAETIRGDFEFLRGRYGEFPIVINEIGNENVGNAGVANMISSQMKLDSDSGDVLSLPRCRYVPRPVDSVFTDGLHYDQPTQRVRGFLAANALLELQYEAPKPGTFTMTAGSDGTITGYSNGDVSGALGDIYGDVSGFPVIQIIATLGSGAVSVYLQGDNVSAMTGSTLIVNGQEFIAGTPTFSAGINSTFADYTGIPGFEFADGGQYALELILED